MDLKYDIYKRLPEDRLLWIDRVIGLDDARQRVAALQSSSLEHYLVYDFRERTIVETLSSEIADLNQIAA